jgi:hypothetical protein
VLTTAALLAVGGAGQKAACASETLAAPVADNTQIAGGTVTLTADGRVGRDADLSGGEVVVHSRVARHLRLSARRATLAAPVGGTVTARVERLTLGPGARVRGDLVVYSPNAPTISPEAKVLGRVDHRPVEAAGAAAAGQPPSGGQNRNPFGDWLAWWVFRFASIFLLGASVLVLVPAAPPVHNSGQEERTNP